MSNDVVVACKLPHGIYLDVGKQRVKLNGTLTSPELTSLFITPKESVGLTKVPRNFWEAWIKDHEEFKPVKKGLIFASENKKEAQAEAKDKKDLKNGFERLDPKSPPKGLSKNIEQIAAGQTN